MSTQDQVDRNLIFRCLTGSRAYGTDNAASDIDIRGVYAADPINLLTPFFPAGQHKELEGDTVYYELNKFVRMVTEQNPNVVELLWVDSSDVLFETSAWGLLKEYRQSLLTTRVVATYGGFATQALQQMRGHDRWINNPQPAEPPQPRDFVRMLYNISLSPEMNTSMPTEGRWTAVEQGRDLLLLYEGGSGSWFDASGYLRTFARHEVQGIISSGQAVAVASFDKAGYDARKRDFDNYWTWKRERNEVRSALEQKFGYDTKNAGHLIRLLRTAEEILNEGIVRVRRPDAKELRAIRDGALTYDEVIEMATAIRSRLPNAEARSTLPKSVDYAMVGSLVMQMYETTWSAIKSMQVVSPAPSQTALLAPDIRKRVVVLDLEMTGYTDHGHHQIVEVGAIEIMGGVKTGRSFHAYVNPVSKLNGLAVKVHGLTSRFLSTQPVFSEIAPILLAFIADAPVVAHDAPNDLRTLNNDLGLSGFYSFGASRFACSARMAQRLFGVQQVRLDGLCDILGVDRLPRERGHSAIMDAAILADCLLRMAELPGYLRAEGVFVTPRVIRDRGRSAPDPEVTGPG